MMRPCTGLAAGVLMASAMVLSGCAAQEEPQTPEGDLMQNSSPKQKNDLELPGFEDAIAEVVATFEAAPGRAATHRWTPSTSGSARIVGSVQKPPSGTGAEFRMLVDGEEIWSRKIGRTDSIRHAFDIVAYDLTEKSEVQFVVIAGPNSPPVKVEAAFQIVPEPCVSRWRADLPSGYPGFTETEKEALRKKGTGHLAEDPRRFCCWGRAHCDSARGLPVPRPLEPCVHAERSR